MLSSELDDSSHTYPSGQASASVLPGTSHMMSAFNLGEHGHIQRGMRRAKGIINSDNTLPASRLRGPNIFFHRWVAVHTWYLSRHLLFSLQAEVTKYEVDRGPCLVRLKSWRPSVLVETLFPRAHTITVRWYWIHILSEASHSVTLPFPCVILHYGACIYFAVVFRFPSIGTLF